MTKLHFRTIKSSERKAMSKKSKRPDQVVLDHEGVLPSYDRFPGTTVTVELQPDEWFEFTLDDVMMMTIEYGGIAEQIKELEARKKQIQAVCAAVHEATNEPRISFGVFKSESIQSHTARRLSPEKLVENGVKADIIEVCYDEGKPYTYVRITPVEG